MKVRRDSVYVFRPALIDRVMTQHHSATEGQRVRVVQLPGAPRPNTMRHAHVVDATSGAFLGIVCTDSLHKP
jgi:hypothetical protein